MSFENKNYAFAGAFVDELARSGLKHVCICPGSRSSPLAISFARNSHIRKWVHLDERSAAFFALGIAKYLREPVAIVCSSGTATANFVPAIVEAHYSLTPLLVLTADRPPELLDWGALQTISQTNMYGSYVKWSVNMPTPEASPYLLAFVRSTAARAMAVSAEKPAGPVHLNFPFREPLEPVSQPTDLPDENSDLQNPAYCGRPAKRPFLEITTTSITCSSEEIRRLAVGLKDSERGLIVCGPGTDENLAECVVGLANTLGFPILADCLSQVRCGPHDRRLVIDCYDVFISDTKVAASLCPEVVIRFGGLPVSKPLCQYLERQNKARHILVEGDAVWRDPSHINGELWHMEPARFCLELTGNVEGGTVPVTWSRNWTRLADETRKLMLKELSKSEDLFEGKVFSELSHLLPEGSLLFAGNSMPVRDMDTFFPSISSAISFMANRGASGIDGVVSTALGAGAASSARLVLVIGDISFYHDMNGLLAAKAFNLDATIIVINNNGGGIFSFLPQAAYGDVFEKYFGTPHGLTFRPAAELYGLEYCLAGDWLTFKKAIKESFLKKGTTIIEVPSERQRNLELHKQMREAILSKLGSVKE